MADTIRIGSKHPKIIRQPAKLIINPPRDGPTAGPKAIVSVANPIIIPIFFVGTCSIMILNIIGSAIPVPAPCRIRPNMSTEKLGDHKPNNVPAIKSAKDAPNKVRVIKRFFNQEDAGIMMANTKR